jgi:enamine deaminase RidA (YjgF/YER057c/UK114 family)
MLGDVRPANTMLYVGGLIGDGFLVEIEAQAVVDP